MIKDLNAKFSGCLNGMILAERVLNEELLATREAFELARVISQTAAAEALAPKLPPVAWVSSSSASLIGLIFHDRFADVFEFCRQDALFKTAASQCAALGASLMVASACFDVPIGVWPNEVATIIKGVDDYFVTLVDEATRRSMEDISHTDFFKEMNAKADADTAVVTMSLFCCLRNQNFLKAVEQARDAGPHVAILTGGAMGAAFPKSVDLADPMAQDLCPSLIARRDF